MGKKLYVEDTKAPYRKVLEVLTQICVIIAISVFFANFLFSYTENQSKSMEPTIVPGSIVFTNRFAYAFSGPKRFDVVSFKRSMDSQDILVRRVIGLPGETIRIYWGKVYINGEELDVSQYLSEITSDGNAETEIHLGRDEYFVIGDQPANSEDSRMSTIGAVRKTRIIGKSWLTAQSITELQLIH